MKTTNIKTYNIKMKHDSPHFFILSKGYNAGKPLESPCPNCFMVTAENEEHKHQLFWICYGMWKSGTFLPLLRGSVIPFLGIREASAEIEKAVQVVSQRNEKFRQQVSQLKQLIHTEKLLNAQIKLINGLKSAIGKRLIRS